MFRVIPRQSQCARRAIPGVCRGLLGEFAFELVAVQGFCAAEAGRRETRCPGIGLVNDSGGRLGCVERCEGHLLVLEVGLNKGGLVADLRTVGCSDLLGLGRDGLAVHIVLVLLDGCKDVSFGCVFRKSE